MEYGVIIMSGSLEGRMKDYIPYIKTRQTIERIVVDAPVDVGIDPRSDLLEDGYCIVDYFYMEEGPHDNRNKFNRYIATKTISIFEDK